MTFSNDRKTRARTEDVGTKRKKIMYVFAGYFNVARKDCLGYKRAVKKKDVNI